MRKWTMSFAFLATLGLLAPTLAFGADDDEKTPCQPPDGHREFRGKVDKISKRELILDNRMGDKLKFKPAKDVKVAGEKPSWKRVKKNDWAIVSWKMMDNPRIAYYVCVIPEVAEEAEDVE